MTDTTKSGPQPTRFCKFCGVREDATKPHARCADKRSWSEVHTFIVRTADERAEFEKAREDAVQAYMDRGTIMRLEEESLLRARADFRAGWHAAWQARAALSADPSRDQRMWEQGRDAAAQFSAAQKGADYYALIDKRTVEQAIRGLTYPGAETTDKENSK